MRRRALVVVAMMIAIACSAATTTANARRSHVRALPRGAHDAGTHDIRVALATSASRARINGAGEWRLYERDGRTLLSAGGPGAWTIERSGVSVRAVRSDGVPTEWRSAIVARAVDGTMLSYNGKHYRGELDFIPGSGDGVLVVNRLSIDDYLRGVVPIELGTRSMADSAALEAQAVAARSYAWLKLAPSSQPYDVVASVTDQAYGGADVETLASSRAVDSTRGLVLLYQGAVVNAPYHSTCGGETAEASEVWRTPPEPYLQRVSDRIPGSNRFYCDISPRFRWTRTLDGATLDAALRTYLSHYAAVPNGDPGRARDVAVDSRTASGRVGYLRITTDRGTFVLRGNDIRYVMRPPGGEILNSTSFTVDTRGDGNGGLASVTLEGTGYGHGVGMCQWGAMGRSRAGQDFETILRTYYPGTHVGTVD